MILKLFKTLDSNNVINKTLTDEIQLDINLKSDTDIINPEIVLLGDFRGFNYAHIPDLNRFYFIERVEQLNMRLVKLSLSCDVLETYKESILNSECEYIREAKNGDKVINAPDSSFNNVAKYESNITMSLDNNIVISTIGVN